MQAMHASRFEIATILWCGVLFKGILLKKTQKNKQKLSYCTTAKILLSPSTSMGGGVASWLVRLILD